MKIRMFRNYKKIILSIICLGYMNFLFASANITISGPGSLSFNANGTAFNANEISMTASADTSWPTWKVTAKSANNGYLKISGNSKTAGKIAYDLDCNEKTYNLTAYPFNTTGSQLTLTTSPQTIFTSLPQALTFSNHHCELTLTESATPVQNKKFAGSYTDTITFKIEQIE